MKKAVLTTTILLGTLLSGAGAATAAPVLGGPTDLASPTVPPQPEPCVVTIRCDVTQPTAAEPPTDIASPTAEPTTPTDIASPAAEPTRPTDVATPTAQPDPSQPPVTTTSRQPQVEQPRNPPSGVPTPTRIDTGEGPAEQVNWFLLVIPALVLLGLAATGTVLVIRRTERRPS
jgi:outer membrane biosynthesis protein TonB